MTEPEPTRTATRTWRDRLDVYRGRGLDRNVKALGAASFFQDVASEMVYPLLPTFILSLGGGAAVLGSMESIAAGILALVKGAMGPLSDQVGRRKPFVVIGYGLSALARPFLVMAALPIHVVGLRVVDRAAKGVRSAPRDALIAESTALDRRSYAFSFHRGLDHLGAAVGPVLAAVVLLGAPGRLRTVFALATIPAVIGWLLVLAVTREAPTTTARTTRRVRSAAPEAGSLRLPLIAFFVFSLGNATDAFILLRGAELGLSAFALTLVWSGFHVVKWVASAPAGQLADRLGPDRLVIAGWVVYAGVYVGFALSSSAGALVGLLGVYALHDAMTDGAEKALVVSMAGGAKTGTVLGAYHLASGLGVFGASVVSGLVWERFSPAAAFALGAGLAGLAAVILFVGTAAGRRPVGGTA